MSKSGLFFPFTLPGFIADPKVFTIGSAQFTVGTQFSGKTFKGELKDSQGYKGSFFYDIDSKSFIPEWPEWNEISNTGGLELIPSYLDLSPSVINSTSNPLYLGNAIIHKVNNEYDLVKNMEWFENGIPISTIDPQNKLFKINSETRGLIIKGNRFLDTTIEGVVFPKVNARNISYSVKFLYLDPVKKAYVKDYIGTEIELIHTLKYIENGEDADYVQIQASTDKFSNPLPTDTLILNGIIKYNGNIQTNLTNVSNITWEYYDPEHVANEHWVKIPIIPGSATDYFTLTISAGEINKAKTYRYSAEIDGVIRRDTIVIRKDQAPLKINISSKAGDLFKMSENDASTKTLVAEISINTHGNWNYIPAGDIRLNDYILTWRKFDQYGQEIINDIWPKSGKALTEITVNKLEIIGQTTITLELVEEIQNKLWYGVTRKLSNASPDFTRIGIDEYHKTLPIHNALKPCIARPDGSIYYWLNPNDITKKIDNTPSDLSGADGQVCLYVPPTYSIIHGKGITGTRDNDTLAIGYAPFSIEGDRAQYFPDFLITLDYTTINSETGALICCANNNQQYKGDLVGTCKTNLSYTEAVTNARLYGNSWIPSFYYAEQLISAFMVIEYATYNLRKSYNPEKTIEGYTQGGLGQGAVNWTSEEWATFNGKKPIHKILEIQNYISALNLKTNGTHVYSKTLVSNGITKNTEFNCWRWLSNPWGHMKKATVGAYTSLNTESQNLEFKMTKVPTDVKANFSLTPSFKLIGNVAKTSGYISEYLMDSFVPHIIGGSSSTKGCGYWNVEGDLTKSSNYFLLGANLTENLTGSRESTDLRLNLLYPTTLAAETVETFSTGLFTLIKQ